MTGSYRGGSARKPFSNAHSCTGVSFEPLLLWQFRACLAGRWRKTCTGVSSERWRPNLRSSPRRGNMHRHNVCAISVLPLDHLKKRPEILKIKVLAMFWRPVKLKFGHFWTSKRYLSGPQIGTFLTQNRYRKVPKSCVLLCLWRFLSFPSESVKIQFSAKL